MLIISGDILGIWVQDAIGITSIHRLSSLLDPGYLHDRLMMFLFGGFNLALLIMATTIAVMKP